MVRGDAGDRQVVPYGVQRHGASPVRLARLVICMTLLVGGCGRSSPSELDSGSIDYPELPEGVGRSCVENSDCRPDLICSTAEFADVASCQPPCGVSPYGDIPTCPNYGGECYTCDTLASPPHCEPAGCI